MKEIQCISLDEIVDKDFRQKCEKEVKNISKLRMWVALIVGPIAAIGACFIFAIFFLLLLSESMVFGLIESTMQGIIGPSLSGTLAGFIASLLFWSFEIVVGSSACMLTIVTLMLAYYPIKSAIVKNAYISKRILIADTTEEVRKAALPYILVFWVYQFFFNKAGLADSLSSAERSYNRGAIIMKTPAFTFAYGSDYIMRMKRRYGRFGKVEYDEHKMEGVEVSIADSGKYTLFAFRDSIAIVEKKNKDEIMRAIEKVDPDALKKKK
jgi:hypothetical protein